MISAVVHTFNEEKNIERCLSSLTGVDEVVLIDMGSTDKTVEIAKKFSVRIYPHAYTGFVEPARNFGISKAKHEWILIVDSDEEIPIKLLKKLKMSISTENDASYFRIPRKNIIFGKWIKYAGWWPDYQVRFFRKGAVTWIDKLHAIPVTKGIGRDLDDNDDESIVHYNYQAVSEYINRLNRYSTIAAKELYLEGKKSSYSKIINSFTNELVKRYFLLQGYREGIHGISISLLQAFSQSCVELKLWELNNFRGEKFELREVSDQLSKSEKIISYWKYNELLKIKHDFFEDIIWKIKRKISSL